MDNTIQFINDMAQNDIDAFSKIYYEVRQLARRPDIKKVIQHQTVEKYFQKSFYCKVCECDILNRYKCIHPSSKKHLAFLAFREKHNIEA